MSRVVAPARRLVVPDGLGGWQSRAFDGVDDQISGTNPLTGNTSYTLVAWLRCARNTGAIQMALHAGTAGASQGAWIGTYQSGGEPCFCGGLYSASLHVDLRLPAPRRSWTRVVHTYDAAAGSARLFINGAQYGAAVGGLAAAISGASARLGRNTAGAYPFAGNVWDARIYSRAWSPTEVAQDYLGHWVDSTGLARWWKLEDLTTATAHEEIGGTDDAVTGALVSPMAPFRKRRVVEDVPCAYSGTVATVADHADLRADSDSFGVMLWVQKRQQTAPIVWQKDGSGTARLRLCYDSGGGVARCWIRDDAGVQTYITHPAFKYNQSGWVHFAACLDRATGLLGFWLNGSLVGSAAFAGGAITNDGTLYLSNSVTAANDILWRKGAVLTPEEIRAHYLEGTVPAGLTCHWPCREGAGTAIADIVGGRNGTLATATWTTKTRGHAREVAPARDTA